MNCSICDKQISILEAFPNDLCVDCYAKTEEANAPLTAQEIKQMFVKSVNI
jgi:hypothetical protein